MRFYTNAYYNYKGILLAEKDENGKTVYSEKEHSPSVYLPSRNRCDLKSINGEPLMKMQFDNHDQYKEFDEKYSTIPGFEIHGEIQQEYQFLAKHYNGNHEYDFSKINIMYIDIETTSEKGFPSIDNPEEEVIVISVTSTQYGKATFCLGTYTTEEDIKVFEYQTEDKLLRDFVQYFSDNYPDVLSGWNIRFFDIPYLVNRIEKVLGRKYVKMLSPWGIIKEKRINRKGKEESAFDLVGISTLDYYEVYKTFTYTNQESYSLNHISYVELGEKKLSYSEFESITEFYKKDFQKFVQYNIRDVELVQKLEEKLRLIELAIALAYSAGVNYADVFSQVRTWDVIIYNDLLKRGIAIPPKKKSKKNEQYAGAYVKEPLVGFHDWVVSFDLNSLYPHLIMHYNISPETMTDDGQRGNISPEGIMTSSSHVSEILKNNKNKNISTAANGTTYRKDIRGFLPDLMDNLYKDRKMFKNKMIESKKMLEDINEELKARGLTDK